jgi:hypothetical protein
MPLVTRRLFVTPHIAKKALLYEAPMRSPKHEADYRVQLAIEDRFIVIKLNQPDALFPSEDIVDAIDGSLAQFPQYTVVCDLRGIATGGKVLEPTYDAIELARGLGGQSHCLATSDDIACLELPRDLKVFEVKSDTSPIAFGDLDLVPFARDHELPESAFDSYRDNFARKLPTKEEYEFAREETYIDQIFGSYDDFIAHWEATLPADRASATTPGGLEILGKRYLESFIEASTRHSLLVELAIQSSGEVTRVVPYHAHALNRIDVNGELWIGRPAVIAKQTQSILRSELASFEKLIARTDVSEKEIQDWLETHPWFFKSLGFAKVYPKVVLERETDGPLIPDFILEPAANTWCEILDIKRPEPTLIAGPSDRKRFSAAVSQLQAQLREYRAYFEDPRLAQSIEKKYGIKCYKPKLIGVIGREIPDAGTREMRRLMTSYSDTEIVTFDRLIKQSQARLLI